MGKVDCMEKRESSERWYYGAFWWNGMLDKVNVHLEQREQPFIMLMLSRKGEICLEAVSVQQHHYRSQTRMSILQQCNTLHTIFSDHAVYKIHTWNTVLFIVPWALVTFIFYIQFCILFFRVPHIFHSTSWSNNSTFDIHIIKLYYIVLKS